MAPGPNEIRPQAQMRLGPGHKPDWDPGTSQIGTWAQTRLGPGLLSSLVPDCVIWFLTQIQFNLSWEWFLGPNIQFRMQCFRPQMIFKAYLIRCQSSNDLQIDLVHWFIFIIRRSRHVHLLSLKYTLCANVVIMSLLMFSKRII